MSNNQEITTVVLIKSYGVKTAKNNSNFIDGLLEMKGTVPFKIWSGKLFDELEKCEYQGTVCQITGKVNEYNGSKSLILSDVKALEEGSYDMGDFFEEKYNIASYVNALNEFVEKRCSDAGYGVYMTVMPELLSRFSTEFAARGHHDAVRGGLLAHTYKVTILLRRIIPMYDALFKNSDEDLLYLGAIFHDIGKIYEYTNGAIVGNGLIVSHHTFGVEIIVQHKDKIIELKGEEFYYRLLAIIEQHHGAWEERPRAIEAYIIHLVDHMEAHLQSMNESLEKGDKPVRIDEFKLN